MLRYKHQVEQIVERILKTREAGSEAKNCERIICVIYINMYIQSRVYILYILLCLNIYISLYNIYYKGLASSSGKFHFNRKR